MQHLRGMLAVEIYETHARIAIEVSDWAEFNQCQSVLKDLYPEQVPSFHPDAAAAAIFNRCSTPPRFGSQQQDPSWCPLPLILDSASARQCTAVLRQSSNDSV